MSSASSLSSAVNPFYASLQSNSASSSGSASSGASGLASVSTFYNLLVTQLMNQDPLNPLSNQDLSSELAQFSVANGVNAIQSSLSSLMDQINQNQGLQAATLIGKTVSTAGNTLQLSGGSAAGAYNLSGDASNVNVLVQNSAGQTLAILPQGSQGSGMHSFTWNGLDNAGATLPAGTYRFSVQAANGSQGVTATPYSLGVVNSVTLGSSGPTLQLSGQAGSVPFSSVQNIS
ncbi:FlgD immunoglobulin-like domain containing protein [Candidatus Igneacidithiobacillus taiwanensis]|uniref:flagellar hook assembly protein FlgD n=1 Tax=Candidatus Igneacidithiobacillus taiwanensis TaxID=1945924 RepID=UPI00289BAB1F|nr:FlgD immunoglobulin-like domain containing protein [Candidatus Igneacidithiobacillus taiwanensis]MCE5359563.1 flagellar biosynthesis protein FlgD [Acidithiobacillus sp.]